MHDESTSLFKSFLRNKWVRIFLIVDVVAIIIAAVILIHRASEISTIIFNIAPTDATISVNGNTRFKNGRYAISPGTYNIEISHKDLETKKITVKIEPRNYVTVIAFIKGADNSFDFYELKNNYSSYQKLKDIASAGNNMTTDGDTSAQEFIANYEKKISIFSVLPIKGFFYGASGVGSSTGGYSIQNGQNNKNCKRSTCLLVSYYGMINKDVIVGKIKDAGYNPNEYEIVYERYVDAKNNK